MNPKLLWLIKAAVDKTLGCFEKQSVTQGQVH